MAQICKALGEHKGTKFTVGSVVHVIQHQRRHGDPSLFPLRRFLDDDGEPDDGIDEATQRRLGL